MKKRLWSMILAVAMCLTMMPVTAVAAEEQDVSTIGLDLTKDTPTVETSYKAGEGTITYSPASEGTSAKLTLNNATITSGRLTIPDKDQAVEILILGSNHLTGISRQSGIMNHADAIYDVTMQGEGSLTIRTTGVGIDTNGKLIIKSGTYEINADGAGMGSYSKDTIIEGGTINITSKGTTSAALMAPNGDVIVRGGTLILDSQGDSAIGGDKDIVITGGVVQAKSDSNGYPAIYSYNGALEIGGTAQVTATSTNSYGLYTNGALTVSDTAQITATGKVDASATVASVAETAMLNGTVRIITDKERTYAVYGDAKLHSDLSVGANVYNNLPAKLNITDGATLTIPEGVTLDVAHNDITIDNLEDYYTNGNMLVVNGTVLFPEGTSLEKVGNITSNGIIKVGQEQNYFIIFDSLGGSNVGSQLVCSGKSATKPENPTKAGYTFDGWYTDATCTKEYDFSTLVTDNLTLYAKWTSNRPSGSVTTPTYPPTVTKPENGDVTVSPTSPKQGETVTITPKPNNGYEVDKITVTDNAGKEIAVKDNGDGTYSFTQPSGSVTIAVTYTCKKDSGCPISKFTDVKTTAWYHDGVHYCMEAGLMEGIGNAKFSPDGVLTRAQLAQILYNKAGKPAVTKPCTFTDVPKDAWYADSVAWAQQNSVVSGIGGNKFAPDEKITREQIAAMLYRSAGSPAVTGILNFKDAGSVSKWATDAMLWATQNKVINGALQSDGALLLNAKLGATRAETATMLENYYNK